MAATRQFRSDMKKCFKCLRVLSRSAVRIELAEAKDQCARLVLQNEILQAQAEAELQGHVIARASLREECQKLSAQTKRAEEAEKKLADAIESNREVLCKWFDEHKDENVRLVGNLNGELELEVESLKRDLATLREALLNLVHSLPKCDKYDCNRPATRAIGRGGQRWCDDHAGGTDAYNPTGDYEHAPPREPEEGGPARAKWYSSGRGIFKQDAASQVACATATVNWQEDTAMMVRLLNAGEGAGATLAEVRKVVAEMRGTGLHADAYWADRIDAAIGGGK